MLSYASLMRSMKKVLPWISLLMSLGAGLAFKKEWYGPWTTLIWLVAIVFWIWWGIFLKVKERNTTKTTKTEIVLLGLLLIIGLGLRVYRLDKLSMGLWTDEIEISAAGKNLMGKMISLKSFLPFTTEATGHPGLTAIFTGLGLKIFGNNVWGLRLPSVLFGLFSIVPLYLLIKELFGDKVGLAAGWIYGVSYWQLSLTRIAFEAGYFWFFFNWCLWALVRFHKEKSLNYLMWLGVFCGLGLYTYQAFRLLFFGFLVIVGIEAFWFQKKGLLWTLFSLTLLGLSFGMMIIPFFFYWRHYPQAVFDRANDVSIFNQKFAGVNRIQMIGENSWKTVGMLFWQGDPNLRHNMAQRPVLNLVEGVLLLAGLAMILVKKQYFILVTIIILGGISAASGIFTYEPPYIIQPHSLRTLGLLPLACLVMAVTLAGISKRIGWKWIIILVLVCGVTNLKNYFGVKVTKEIYDAFQTDQTRTARLVAGTCGSMPTISGSLINKPHLEFLASRCRYQVFNGTQRSGLLILSESDYQKTDDKEKTTKVSFETWLTE